MTFDHPINAISAMIVAGVDLIDHDSDLSVVVFGSADPDFYLGRYGWEDGPRRAGAMPAGPTGRPAWTDVLGGWLSLRASASPRFADARSARAEEDGYLDRLIADDELDGEVDRIASRVGRLDGDAFRRTKSHFEQATLPKA